MLLLLLLAAVLHLSHQDCSWNTCNKWSTDKNTLKVHLIPHTHDDLGWIKTVDQYYYGSKPALVPVGVQYIYNTVIDELQKNPERKFSFAETGFLWRWFSSNSDFDRHKLQKLVKTGQIEIIGGGWTQNDEAAAHYVDIIDQMTFGLKKLTDIFGDCGKAQVAWQIDPFGHSREQANLFAMMGYSSLFFARIHYLEKEARLQNKSLEFVWNASDDLKTQILTGAFYQDNYGPPPGFCWDALCGDDPIMDNPDLEDYNVDEKVKAFTDHVKKQASFQRSSHVMLLMGSDFQYTNANAWYTNLDKLIRYVNNDTNGVQVFYSTPSCYVKGLMEAQPHLTSKDDDFFPYASSNHSYWTGYFTSRPSFKGMIRHASSVLQLAKRLDAVADLGPSDDSDVEVMQKASALMQHHDAVTGTAKENVTKDYYKHLGKALVESELVVNDFLKVVMAKKDKRAPSHMICQLINETVCEATVDASTFAVTILNAQGKDVDSVVTIPFYSKQAIVTNDEGQRIDSQIFKTFLTPMKHPQRAPYELSFTAQIPALGYRTYVVDNSTSIRAATVVHPIKKKLSNEPTIISNEFISLNFDASGYLTSFTELSTNTTKMFRQQFFYYKGVDNTTNQPSGAYIFRPNSTEPIAFNETIKLDLSKGSQTEEVRQTISPWVSQIVRLRRGSPAIEFDWIVGPIPKEENQIPVTKELVSRYYTDIQSENVFYTDANGRQMMKRKVGENPSFSYDDSEPVAGNYYPVTNRLFIKDGSRQMTVLTDRAQGGSSRQGMIELMIHRRCFFDDHWGVEEALDELGIDGRGLIVRGTHYVLLSSVEGAAAIHRQKAMDIFYEPVLAFTQIRNATSFRNENNLKFAGLSRPLPAFVNLLSLEKWTKKSLLVRFEHILQNEEDKENSRPMNVDIRNIFTRFDIVSMNELMLAGNRNKTSEKTRGRRTGDFSFQLKPQEIRTFEIDVNWK